MRHAICDQNKKKQVGTFPHYAHSFLFALNFTTYGIFDFLPAHCLRLYKGHCNAGRLLTAMRSRRRFDLTATAKDGNTRSFMMMKHMFLLRDNFFSCEDSWKATNRWGRRQTRALCCSHVLRAEKPSSTAGVYHTKFILFHFLPLEDRPGDISIDVASYCFVQRYN